MIMEFFLRVELAGSWQSRIALCADIFTAQFVVRNRGCAVNGGGGRDQWRGGGRFAQEWLHHRQRRVPREIVKNPHSG
jgi:hypothetical protein